MEIGDRAPYTGTLLDDAALREIDAEMTDLRNCERRLGEAPEGSGLGTHLMYMAAGVLLGGIVIGAVR